MKILLRSDYTWHEATYDVKSQIFNVDGNPIQYTSVVSIKDDNRNQYVTCKGCGATIPNNPEDIAKHMALGTSRETCLTCQFKRPNYTSLSRDDVSLIRNDDNTYTEVQKRNLTLYCLQQYYKGHRTNIHDPNGMSHCIYKDCATKGTTSFTDFFTEHPNIFDDIITVDALDKKKWHFISKADHVIIFTAMGSPRLHAKANHMGIIDRFTLEFRSSAYDFVYSNKYDKIFWMRYGNYTEECPVCSISATSLANIYKKVSNIYKGADIK